MDYPSVYMVTHLVNRNYDRVTTFVIAQDEEQAIAFVEENPRVPHDEDSFFVADCLGSVSTLGILYQLVGTV